MLTLAVVVVAAIAAVFFVLEAIAFDAPVALAFTVVALVVAAVFVLAVGTVVDIARVVGHG